MAKKLDIGGELHSVATDHKVADASEIKDISKGNKSQTAFNNDVDRHEVEIHGTGGIESRLKDVEQIEQIVLDGGEAQIAQGSDFTNPDAIKRAKIPTVGAIVDGLNDGIYDVSKRNPTGGPNGDGKFTLEYILNQNNVNTLIPTGWRHRGMIISFASSSENKYVQYRLIADEWSVDIDDWAICEDSVLVENQDYIKAETDSTGKILWGIKADGTVFFGAGCPPQVKEYVLKHKAEIIAELSTKVDKVEGKGLSTNDYTDKDKEIVNAQEIIYNDDFVEAEVDKANKILGGRKVDGTRFENCPIETPVSKTSYINHSDWIRVDTDASGKIIEGVKKDGTKYISSLEVGKEVKQTSATTNLTIKNNNRNEKALLPNDVVILDAGGNEVQTDGNYGTDGKVLKFPINTDFGVNNAVIRFKVKFNDDLNKRHSSIDYTAENPSLLNFLSIVSGEHKLSVGVLPDYIKNEDIGGMLDTYGPIVGIQGQTVIKAVNASNIATAGDAGTTGLLYENFNYRLLAGEQMFSIRWIDNTAEYADVCMSNDGTTLTFYHSTDDSIISSYTLASYGTLKALYDALDADSHIEVKPFDMYWHPSVYPYTQERTPADLMEFEGIKLVVSRNVVDGNNLIGHDYPTKQVYDNPPVIMYDKIDDKWHTVEIAAIDNIKSGTFCICVDGFYLYTSEKLSTLSNPTVYIGGDENGAKINCSIKDIEIKYNNLEDTEIVSTTSGTYPMIISNWHPKVYCLEVHEVEDIIDPSDVQNTDDTVYTRLEAVFTRLKEKGYIPISLDEIDRYIHTGELAYKRAFISTYDDTRYSTYLNPRIQSLHKRFNVRAHLSEVTNVETYTYNGVTYNVSDLNDEMLRDGWEPLSHGRHQMYERVGYEDLLTYMEQATSDTRALHIPRKGFVWPGGGANIMCGTVMREYGWGFAFGIPVGAASNCELNGIKRCNNDMKLPRLSVSHHNNDYSIYKSIL